MRTLPIARLGRALILSAGDSETFRESRTLMSAQQENFAAKWEESSSPQDAASSTLQACAPQI
jgi:hypothetical protein